jgi:hypothetical protein
MYNLAELRVLIPLGIVLVRGVTALPFQFDAKRDVNFPVIFEHRVNSLLIIIFCTFSSIIALWLLLSECDLSSVVSWCCFRVVH